MSLIARVAVNLDGARLLRREEMADTKTESVPTVLLGTRRVRPGSIQNKHPRFP